LAEIKNQTVLKFQKINETNRKLMINNSNVLSKIDMEKIENEAREKEAEIKNREQSKRRTDFQKFKLNERNKVYNTFKFTDKDNNIQKPKVVNDYVDKNRKQFDKFYKECKDKAKEDQQKMIQTKINHKILKQSICRSNKSGNDNEIVPIWNTSDNDVVSQKMPSISEIENSNKIIESKSEAEEIDQHEMRLSDIHSSKILTTQNAPSIESEYSISNDEQFMQQMIKKLAILLDIKLNTTIYEGSEDILIKFHKKSSQLFNSFKSLAFLIKTRENGHPGVFKGMDMKNLMQKMMDNCPELELALEEYIKTYNKRKYN
jgi:hypothetical protein